MAPPNPFAIANQQASQSSTSGPRRVQLLDVTPPANRPPASSASSSSTVAAAAAAPRQQVYIMLCFSL